MQELIRKRRSIRRFQQKPIPTEQLEKFVDAARLAPSAANRQPLEYIIIHQPDLLDPVFQTLKWAGYIRPLGDPPEKEHPVAYIVVLVNTQIKEEGYEKDAGAAIENLILCALSSGVGSCWISSVDREALAGLLNIPPYCLISDVIGMGYPNEDPVAFDIPWGESIKYYKDHKGRLNVPKRSLESILYYNRYEEEEIPESEPEEKEEEELEWVMVFETSVEEEAVITKGFLENNNIPCVMESAKFHEMPVNFSLMSQTKLLVPTDCQEEACNLIRERKTLIECPNCGEMNFIGGLFCPHCGKPTTKNNS
jgi:nitroreductase